MQGIGLTSLVMAIAVPVLAQPPLGLTAVCELSPDRSQYSLGIVNTSAPPIVAWAVSATIKGEGNDMRLTRGQDHALGLVNPSRWRLPLSAGDTNAAAIHPARPATECVDAAVTFALFEDQTYVGNPSELQRVLGHRRTQATEALRLRDGLHSIGLAGIRNGADAALYRDRGLSLAIRAQLGSLRGGTLTDSQGATVLQRTLSDLSDYIQLLQMVELPVVRRPQ